MDSTPELQDLLRRADELIEAQASAAELSKLRYLLSSFLYDAERDIERASVRIAMQRLGDARYKADRREGRIDPATGNVMLTKRVRKPMPRFTWTPRGGGHAA